VAKVTTKWKERIARSGAMRGKDVVCEVEDVEQGRARLACTRNAERRARLRFRNAVSSARMCPNLLLTATKAAFREKMLLGFPVSA